MVMNWKCFFNGHDHESWESGQYNEVCKRCGCHDYYDSIHADPSCRYVKSFFHSYEFTLPTMIKAIKIWLFYRFETSKCHDCKKHYKRFGFNVGNHDNCLPF